MSWRVATMKSSIKEKLLIVFLFVFFIAYVVVPYMFVYALLP